MYYLEGINRLNQEAQDKYDQSHTKPLHLSSGMEDFPNCRLDEANYIGLKFQNLLFFVDFILGNFPTEMDPKAKMICDNCELHEKCNPRQVITETDHVFTGLIVEI
jgi:hypothetical protein